MCELHTLRPLIYTLLVQHWQQETMLVKFNIKHNQNYYLKLDVSSSIRSLHQKKLVLSSFGSWHDGKTPCQESGRMRGSVGSCPHHGSWPVCPSYIKQSRQKFAYQTGIHLGKFANAINFCRRIVVCAAAACKPSFIVITGCPEEKAVKRVCCCCLFSCNLIAHLLYSTFSSRLQHVLFTVFAKSWNFKAQLELIRSVVS